MSRADEIPWTDSLEANFKELKQQLLQPRIIRIPDSDRPFILETDGSRVAVGAVLKQKFDDTGLEHPVGFFSRALSGSERNYAAYKVELYAVVPAVEHFRMFLLGKEFLLRNDHAALRNLLRRDIPPTSRGVRWILRLSEYSFKIEYQRGQDNVIADVLSRLPFASAKSSNTSTPFDKLSNTINPAESEVPRSNSSDKQSTSLNASELTSEYPQSDNDISDSNYSDTEFEFESSDSEEIDLDDAPQDSSPEEFNSLDVAAPLIELPISREGIQAADYQIPTS